jgi:hypothetical protein
MIGVDPLSARGVYETPMLHPEGENQVSVRFSALFEIEGRNAGKALGANGDEGLAPDALARSESGGRPSSA